MSRKLRNPSHQKTNNKKFSEKVSKSEVEQLIIHTIEKISKDPKKAAKILSQWIEQPSEQKKKSA
ncbi:MAG: hypothetical protein CL678_12755 [Bdellovibrionaceae bacterium]|nr:hypothetical protein [Pseudobdellovibrionaceae bacterium]